MLISLKIDEFKSLILRDYLVDRFAKDIAKDEKETEISDEF